MKGKKEEAKKKKKRENKFKMVNYELAASSQINIAGCLVTRTSSRQALHHCCSWEHSASRRKRNFSATFFLGPVSHWLTFVPQGINSPSLASCDNWLIMATAWEPGTHPTSWLRISFWKWSEEPLRIETGWAWAPCCWVYCYLSGGWARVHPSLGEAEKAGKDKIGGNVSVNGSDW